MIYAISDLHGCYDKYIKMLEKIKFSDNDTLYILGDVVDRGKESIRILLDMMEQKNVIPLIGNHEYSFNKIVENISYNRNIDDFMLDLDEWGMSDLGLWMMNGGRKTLEQYLALSAEEKRKLIQYVNSFAKYIYLDIDGKKFLLTHSGLDNFDAEKSLDEYKLTDFIFHRPKMNTTFYNDKTIIFGHTPTPIWDESTKKNPKIFKGETFYNIDCGCVFTGRLGCLELDTLKEYYV